MTRKLRKQIGFHHLLRLETGPAIYSFLVKYKEPGFSYLAPGKLIYKHEIDFSRARGRRIQLYECVWSAYNVQGTARGPEVE